ncbi:AAA family ATPase [Natronorubrum bangense]|uniref:ORC1-type DNA replication protein n=1 Tax=Natronorubrum bangense JCM 10635 TaxID=1227500 RepID=L9VZY3_9EURY|nr:AAA family ATPase [Natronorubrum bangense]ELY42627.1 cell division control protein 6-like protein [Natronorubrum bangense JCM 10635]
MSGPFSDVSKTIFDDKTVLTESYQPEEILERDEEIEEYRYALQDVLFGSEPDNVFLYGKAGLGKTAVTKYMTDSLVEEANKREEADDVHVQEINCNGKSLFSIVRSLVNNLLPSNASPFPKRGLGTADAFEELYRQLDRIGGSHLMVFDEIDHLDDADTLLYELPRARSNGHITKSRIGVIGISNNYTFRKRLSSKVKDTLMETEISFTPYDANELMTILQHRADQAFVDGACDRSAIAKAAALSAQDRGNARQAIDLLRAGAEVAQKEDEETVIDNHVEAARTLVQRGRLQTRIREQTDHSQYILETIAKLDEKGETPSRSKQIHKEYERVADAYASTPRMCLARADFGTLS